MNDDYAAAPAETQLAREALLAADGVDLTAARRIDWPPEALRALRCADPTVQAAQDEARRNVADEAESKMIELMRGGVLGAVSFLLRLQAGDRSAAAVESFVLDLPENGRTDPPPR